MNTIHLGLGTSDARGLFFLKECLRMLKTAGWFTFEKQSSIFKSDAQLPDHAPKEWNCEYLNLVVQGTTPLPPIEVLDQIKKIEKTLGRKDRARWAPREIDIDILSFNKEVVHSTHLNIPHQSLLDRPFALLPLLEICPDWTHPLETKRQESQLLHWKIDPPFKTRATQIGLTEYMGILNCTPDSFSDGGSFATVDSIATQMTNLINQGVTVIDIGAESTRPNAQPVTTEQETQRLSLAIAAWDSLAPALKSSIELSIDSRNLDTLNEVKNRCKIAWINDVSGGTDPRLAELARELGTKYVFMHNLGVPPSPNQTLDPTVDPIEQIIKWGQHTKKRLEHLGLTRSQLIFDPGIGFGKTVAQNFEILARAEELYCLQLPILIGHSRKSFLKPVTGDCAPNARDLATEELSQKLIKLGIDYLRVHNPIPSNL